MVNKGKEWISCSFMKPLSKHKGSTKSHNTFAPMSVWIKGKFPHPRQFHFSKLTSRPPKNCLNMLLLMQTQPILLLKAISWWPLTTSEHSLQTVKCEPLCSFLIFQLWCQSKISQQLRILVSPNQKCSWGDECLPLSPARSSGWPELTLRQIKPIKSDSEWHLLWTTEFGNVSLHNVLLPKDGFPFMFMAPSHRGPSYHKYVLHNLKAISSYSNLILKFQLNLTNFVFPTQVSIFQEINISFQR